MECHGVGRAVRLSCGVEVECGPAASKFVGLDLERHRELGTADELVGGSIGRGFDQLRGDAISLVLPCAHQVAVAMVGVAGVGVRLNDCAVSMEQEEVVRVWCGRQGDIPCTDDCIRSGRARAAGERETRHCGENDEKVAPGAVVRVRVQLGLWGGYTASIPDSEEGVPHHPTSQN